jgi:hypothetical protein
VKIRYVKYYDFDYPFDGLKIGEFEAVLNGKRSIE